MINPKACNFAHTFQDFSGRMDTAILNVHYMSTISYNESLSFFRQSTECWKCPTEVNLEILKNATCHFVVNSTHSTVMEFFVSGLNQTKKICSFTEHFVEGSNNSIWVSGDAPQPNGTPVYSCSLSSNGSAFIPYLPILVAFLVYLLLSVLWFLGSFMYRKGYVHRMYHYVSFNLSTNDDEDPMLISSGGQVTMTTDEQPANRRAVRLRSLDSFRGLCLVIMIFVNYGGGGYWFFQHSIWNGLTVADLVFPWFVFIMGSAISLSFNSQLRKGRKKSNIGVKVVKRAAIIVFLGICLNASGDNRLSTMRFPGVLQRLGISYLVTALLHLIAASAEESSYELSRLSAVKDIIQYWIEWLCHLSLLVTYLLVTLLVPAPGCPRGYVGPGGLHDHQAHRNCTGGIAGYIDRAVFGNTHIYQRPTCKTLYETTMPYDPEGVLGTLTSIFLCFLGLQAGKVLLHYTQWKQRTTRWLSWCLFTGILALVLSHGSQNDGWIPINKNLWSVSFIFANASLAFLLLTLMYLVIDVYDFWTGAPFYFTGMNSMLIYVCHEVFAGYFPVSWQMDDLHSAQLAIDLWGTTFWVAVSAYLFYIKLFLVI